jgi:hypothetical protein
LGSITEISTTRKSNTFLEYLPTAAVPVLPDTRVFALAEFVDPVSDEVEFFLLKATAKITGMNEIRHTKLPQIKIKKAVIANNNNK